MSDQLIPMNWQLAKLGDISSDISYGYTASATIEPTGVKLLRITDIQNNTVNWPTVPNCTIDSEKIEKYRLKPGDLVFARTGATVGKSYLLKGEIPKSVYASYLIRVRCLDDISVEFLSRYFRSPYYWRQITDFSAGIGQPNVNGTKLKNLSIPLPPLAEQKAIAEKLDTLLSQVENTKARLERIPKILKRFRQSVLAAAVSGKLTAEWRLRNKSHSQLLVEELKSTNKHKPKPYEPSSPRYEIDSTWSWERLGDIFAIKSGTSIKLEMLLENGRVPYFKVSDMNSPENALHMRTSSLFVCEDRVSRKTLLPKDSIVFPKRGGAINTNKKRILGQTSLVDLNIMGILPTGMITEFVYRWFSTIDLAQLNTGSTIPQVNNGDIEPLWVPVPSKEEQTEIVRRVDQLFAYADTIETQVNNALERVNNLTQSILAKAFRGELTEQWRKDNPALISGENSAEALLEKIKVERAAAKPVKRGRKKAQ